MIANLHCWDGAVQIGIHRHGDGCSWPTRPGCDRKNAECLDVQELQCRDCMESIAK